ncbi:kinesin-like protein KIF20B [Synchiropus picturatus]
MMQSCLSWKPERVGPVDVDDIKRNLLEDFSAQTENLQVYLRVRPLTSAERESGETEDCVTIESPETVVLKPPRSSLHNRQREKPLLQTAQRFTFTQVFGPDATQRKVFDGSVRGLVRQVLDGSNSLVFTYGVTNAGKTFTFLGPDHDGGLLPRSLSVIFNSLAGRLYPRCDLKPQRCRDFSRLTPEQQTFEATQKKNLLRLCKEADKSVSGSKSTFLDGSSVCSDSINGVPDDSFTVDYGSNIQFSIWISFCEIYNDNVHDLLDQVPVGQKRQFLRLSQDVKGNSYIKDLRWVQVNNSEEAYRLMKVGKKNQSISATRLNQESSRSHSIFSIRIMRVDHVGVPRVVGISELVLCDLAGSERCSRTNNTGKRLKEAGNINTSLLTLGKCLQSLRLNSQNKFQHHVPFRESKLTHFLQFFFSGASRVTMVVNINQNFSNMDETLNVLKFSALAQKVVMVNSQPMVVDPVISGPERSLNMIEAQKNVMRHGRKSSLIAWETSLEDVLEDVDEDGEEEEEEFEESEVEGTVLEAGEEEEEGEEDRTMEVDKEVEKQGALRLLLEAQIREEVCAEFRDIFTKMEKDFSDRLEKEREILEQRAEKRVEILKNLVTKMGMDTVKTDQLQGEQAELWEGFIHSMSRDLEKIREDAESVHQCLTQQTQAAELEALRLENKQSHDQLLEANESLELQRNKLSGLEVICEQKNEQIKKLEDEMKTTLERAERDKGQVEMLKAKLLELEKSCSCARLGAEDQKDCDLGTKNLTDQDLTDRNQQDRKRQKLTETDDGQRPAKKSDCGKCAYSWSSLEREQRETARLMRENKAVINGMFQLQTRVKSLEEEVQNLTEQCTRQSEEQQELLAQNQELQTQLEKGEEPSVFHATIKQLRLESEAALESSIQKSQHIQQLQQDKDQLEARLSLSETRCSQLSEDVRGLKEELERRDNELQKREEQRQMREDKLRRQEEQRQMAEEEFVRVKEQRRVIEEKLIKMEEKLEGLEVQRQVRLSELQMLEEQLQSREEEIKRRGEQQKMAEKEQKSEENLQSITQEQLEMYKEKAPQTRDELLPKEEKVRVGEEELSKLESQKTEEQLVEEQTSPVKMQSKFSVVEELKEELLKFKEKKEQRQREKLWTQAVLKPVRHDQNIPPVTMSACDGKKNLRTTARKRKSYEVEDLESSENKRNRGRGIHATTSSGKSILGRLANTAPKQRRGRRKLFKADISTPLSISPVIVTAEEEKESAHAIVKRQLRSKCPRK